MELIGGLDHHIGRAGDQVMGLQKAVNRGFRHEVTPFVGKAHRQLPWAQLGLLQCQFDDLIKDVRRDPVPHAARCRWPIFQRLRSAFEEPVVPAVERPACDPQLVEGELRRQMRLLDDPDDLELLGCGISIISMG